MKIRKQISVSVKFDHSMSAVFQLGLLRPAFVPPRFILTRRMQSQIAQRSAASPVGSTPPGSKPDGYGPNGQPAECPFALPRKKIPAPNEAPPPHIICMCMSCLGCISGFPLKTTRAFTKSQKRSSRMGVPTPVYSPSTAIPVASCFHCQVVHGLPYGNWKHLRPKWECSSHHCLLGDSV